MKELLNHIYRVIFIFLTVAALQSCGGSGKKEPIYTISADITAINFKTEIRNNTTESVKVAITFEGEGLLVGFSPNSTPIAWLSFRTENVTANSAEIFIDVVNAQNIMADLYTTQLRFSTGDIATRNLVHHDIDVSLLIWNQLTFGDTFGTDNIDSQTIEFSNKDNTWTVHTDVEWLTTETVYDEETQKSSITVTPVITETDFSTAGLYQANLIFTGPNGNNSQPVNLGLDNVYLYADTSAIAFTTTGNIKATEQIITVGTNAPAGISSINWQATTYTPWITITPIIDSNKIKISADTNLAPDNQISTANIIIAPLDESDIVSESIKVSLYKSELITENTSISEIAVNDNAMVTSPLLPYVYLGVDNELRVYNQYTAEIVATLTVAPTELLLENFVIHPNGKLLLASAVETTIIEDEEGNTTETTETYRYKIDLSELTFVELENTDIQLDPIKFVRLHGRYFVVTQAFEFTTENLDVLFSDNLFSTRSVNVAQLTNTLFALDVDTSNFKRYTTKLNDYTANILDLTLTHEYRPENLSNTDDIFNFVVSDDEKNIYAISPTSEWISFDGESFIDHGLLNTGLSEENINNTVVAINKSTNNRPHFVRIAQNNDFFVNIYNNQQRLTATIDLGINLSNTVALSSDNKRMFINAQNTQIVDIVTLSQFDVSPMNLSFSGALANNSYEAQVIEISGIDENWQATTTASWLEISQLNNEGLSQLSVNIISADITTSGQQTGTIMIDDPASGTSTIITVELTIEE